MSPVTDVATTLGRRFPRVSGDEPRQAWTRGAPRPFSPRERG